MGKRTNGEADGDDAQPEAERAVHVGYRPFCTIYSPLRSPPRGISPFKSRQSHMYSTYLILLPRDRNRTRRGSKTRVRDLHECACRSPKQHRSDRSTRPIGAQTRIRLHIWGFFAEDGEESSVVVLGSAKRRPKWQSLDRLHLCQHGQSPMPRPIRVLPCGLRNETRARTAFE